MDFVIRIVLIVMMVPIVAIVGGLGTGIIKMILSHLERKAELRANTVGAGNNSMKSEFDSLRQEVARLRDTSTQYDISIQHTLEELHRRVEMLESSRRNGSVPAHITQDEESHIAVNRQA